MKKINLVIAGLTGLTALMLSPVAASAQTAKSETTAVQAVTPRSEAGVGTLANKLENRMGRVSEKEVQKLLSNKSAAIGQAGNRAAPTTKNGNSKVDTLVEGRTFGTANLHFTHSRVANFTTGTSTATGFQPVSGYPFVASGRLLIGFGATEAYTSSCSASLIGRGVIVTAAHCISRFGGGTASLARHVRFIPGNFGNTTTSGPYGSWYWSRLRVPTAYLNGTDPDTGTGVVTNNDVAVIELQKRNSLGQLIYPWNVAQIFFYAYGWNYNASNVTPNGLQAMTSLGYPGNYDGGQQMQRFDSQATPTGSGADGNPFQWIRGGNMAPGSSGGPWLVNFGTVPTATGGTLGVGGRNVVVGVTSWWTGDAVKRNGSSRFGQNPQFPNASYAFNGINYGAGNIGALMQALCGTDGAQVRGACF